MLANAHTCHRTGASALNWLTARAMSHDQTLHAAFVGHIATALDAQRRAIEVVDLERRVRALEEEDEEEKEEPSPWPAP